MCPDDERHLRQRKLMLAPFHGERMQRHVKTMLLGGERMKRLRFWREAMDPVEEAIFGLIARRRADAFRPERVRRRAITWTPSRGATVVATATAWR